MMSIRKSSDRGQADHGWLHSFHTFSFASYYDSDYMGFRSLRVINEDRVIPGKGFPTHQHDNMEILSYVLEGALEHKDSMGNHGVLHSKEFQRISAGTGITHSEFNASRKKPVHFYQIWLLPNQQGLVPSYEQKSLAELKSKGPMRLVASPDGAGNSLLIHQDVRIYLVELSSNQSFDFPIAFNRYAWIQVIRGPMTIDHHSMSSGDGVAISKEKTLHFEAKSDAEIMLFDLA